MLNNCVHAIQFVLIIIVGLEVAALHDAYVDHPLKVEQAQRQYAFNLSKAAFEVSHHATLPAPRRHQ